MTKPIYLDYNGTTPHAPEVIEAMRPFLETEFGNPSSSHWYGIAPQKAVDRARRQVAGAINCRPQEVLFTSGGTESNNHAIIGTARLLKNKGNHIITSAFEHPAVLAVCRYLENEGFETTYLPVGSEGVVDPSDVNKAIRSTTVLITIMHANNEVGTIQPIADIASIARQHQIAMHTDAAQSVGKIPTDIRRLGIDLLSVAGHKVYAPKGIGALYVRSPLKPQKFFHGANQEMGWRAGTENVMQIVGLGKACEIAAQELSSHMSYMRQLRDRFQAIVADSGVPARINGHLEKRLPNTLSLSFKGLAADRILGEIGRQVAASAGAACHSNTVEISHVLQAMNVPEKWAKGTVRFSLGRMTTRTEIDKAAQVVIQAIKKLQVLN